MVVVTVAPGASDTEHTLNTLRNACMMAGLEPNVASESRTEVPLVDHGAAFTVYLHLASQPWPGSRLPATESSRINTRYRCHSAGLWLCFIEARIILCTPGLRSSVLPKDGC